MFAAEFNARHDKYPNSLFLFFLNVMLKFLGKPQRKQISDESYLIQI